MEAPRLVLVSILVPAQRRTLRFFNITFCSKHASELLKYVIRKQKRYFVLSF